VPAWEDVIFPLADAPLPRGAVVTLLTQLGASDAYNRLPAPEAAWRMALRRFALAVGRREVWIAGLLAAYLTPPLGLGRTLRFSLDRELAVPLPIMLAVGLWDARFLGRAAARPAPDTAPAG